MYIVIKWDSGWVLDSMGYATVIEANEYIERQCLHREVSNDNYAVAKLVTQAVNPQ